MHQALLKLKRFEKHPLLALAHFGEKGHTLSLRTVDLHQDLSLFFQWMDDPHLQLNWGLRENSQRLDKHYQLFLESEDRQSFLIEKSEEPLFQFDIFLIHYHELYFRIPTTTGDCILNYIILYKDETKFDLKNALSLQLKYFFSYPECRRLWIPIPEQQTELKKIFTEAGFKYRASYTARQQRYDLFFLKRAEYIMDKDINS
jgi:Acetyltransferase (GNAT) domain